jgi:NAD(P)-dependent dehydrogenase (short-subunit alcohol dehydrogenase family)
MGDPGAILITGCSSGIGRATAQHLADSGHMVYATARRPESLSELERAGCRTLGLDVLDEQSMAAAVAEIEAEHGAVGALVNNAGYSVSGAIEALPLEAIRAEFETNFFGGLRLAQLVLPGMRRAGAGRIVNLSSLAGRVTMPGAGAYAASKYAIEAISDAMRFEVRGFGVHVIVIEPGPIRTAFTETANSALTRAGNGPYAAYHAAVAKADADTDESFIAGTPKRVARTIARALRDDRPRTRYRVTAVARVVPAVRGALGVVASTRSCGHRSNHRSKAPAPGDDVKARSAEV